MRILFLLLTCTLLFSCSKFAKVQKSKDYDYKLKMADEYYGKKKYNYAQQLYEELFPIVKGTEKFENVYFKYAYCAFNQRDYMNAENLFKGFVEVFPTSPRAEEMSYMRAFSYYKQSPKLELDQTNTHKAIGFMQTFINTHPGSARNKEATDIIDRCRAKLEAKEERSADLYYNVGQFKAAAIAFNNLLNSYPDSQKADQYKLRIIHSYFQYAGLSVDEKKQERYTQVITECNDFMDKYPNSSLVKEVEKFLSNSQNTINNIKEVKYEQVKKTT